MRMFVLIAGLTLASPALAQTKMVLADCKAGGCRCSLSEMDGRDVATFMLQEPPTGWQDMVLVGNDGDYFWSTRSREDIDTAFGGDGQCDLELFGKVVPEDGQWLGKPGNAVSAGCPPGLDAQVQPELDAMAFPRAVVWGGRFDPDKASVGGTNRVITWNEVRPDHFTGAAVTNGGAGSSSVVNITVDYTATLISPTQMAGTMALRIKARGANAAALKQLGMADCRVDVPFSFDKVGG